MSDDLLLSRVRAEYLEMPGLHLTLGQAQRLCGVERAACQRVLDTLVGAGFLRLDAHGSYARATDGDVVRPTPVKAGLRQPRHTRSA